MSVKQSAYAKTESKREAYERTGWRHVPIAQGVGLLHKQTYTGTLFRVLVDDSSSSYKKASTTIPVFTNSYTAWEKYVKAELVDTIQLHMDAIRALEGK